MDWVSVVVTLICAIFASTGFWALIQKLLDRRDWKSKMILGLGHDRIVNLGMQYIKRGYITKDEYEDLHKYLYVPYIKMHGNGSAERIMKEVDKLPIRDSIDRV